MTTSNPSRTADAIRAELMATVDPKAADERLLAELAANAAIIALQIDVATDRLARVLPDVLADARKAAVIAKTLHETVLVGSALAKRIENLVSTVSTLRVQRRVHRRGAE